MYVIVLLFVIQDVYSQVPFFGPCPQVSVMQNFDPFKYIGKWYEAERYFALFEFGGKCVTAEYAINNKGEVEIYNQQISSLTGIRASIDGVGNSLERSDVGKLSVIFPSLPVQFTAPYWVLGTDYENYSVVWSCMNFGFLSTKNAWILTRKRRPPLEIIDQAYRILDQNGISRQYFMRTDQTNCPSQH